MHAVLSVVLVIATAVTAAAQAPTKPPFEENDGATAVALSIGGTVGSLVVIPFVPSLGLAGLVVGPSFGRWYNHELGAIGLGVRTGAVVYALATLNGLEDCDCDDQERTLYLSLAAIGVASIADYVQAGLGAERYNDAHRPRLQIAPTLVGDNTPGLALGFQW